MVGIWVREVRMYRGSELPLYRMHRDVNQLMGSLEKPEPQIIPYNNPDSP